MSIQAQTKHGADSTMADNTYKTRQYFGFIILMTETQALRAIAYAHRS